MADSQHNLLDQKRLLVGLGFGFLEEGVELPQPQASETPQPPRRRPVPQGPVPPPRTRTRPQEQPVSALPVVDRAAKEAALAKLKVKIADCTRCGLRFTRHAPLAGGGNPDAEVFVVGELPTAEDDRAGIVATGELGELLENILKAMSLKQEDIFLTHAVRCAPSAPRPPHPDEVQACRPFLVQQIEIVRPRVILCFGAAGAEALLPEVPGGGMARNRGRWLDYRGIPLMMTFSLSYMHRHRERKKVVWGDLQQMIKRLGG